MTEIFRIPLQVPMRDGAVLAADLYTAEDPAHLTQQPVVLQRTCYDRYQASYREPAEYLAARGYAAVVQDCRGRNESGGVWRAGEQEAEDGYDTIEWLAAQNFANGDVGTFGGSYPGWLQMAAEALRPPSLKTMIVTSGYMQTMRVHGRAGDVLLPRALTWVHKMSHRNMRPRDTVDWDEILRRLPLAAAADDLPESRDMWRRWMEHPALPDPISADTPHRIGVPTLHISGWEDEPGQFHVYRRAVDEGSQGQFLMVGPWDHPGTRDPKRVTRGFDYGDQSVVNMHEIYEAWFDTHLKGRTTAFTTSDHAAVFTTGVNEWRSFGDWPVVDSRRTVFHLRSRGDQERGVLSEEPAQVAESVHIAHDPMDPVTTHRAADHMSPMVKNDVRALRGHPGVAGFCTPVLSEALEIDGTLTLEFVGTSTAASADWCVWIVDESPDGGLKRLTAGMTRAQRKPNESGRVVVDVGPISHRVAAGHRLGCYIAGSHFPVWNTNLGVADFDAFTTDFVRATNTITIDPVDRATLTLQLTGRHTKGLVFEH